MDLREEIERQWRGLLDGTRTREQVSQWAEPWVVGDISELDAISVGATQTLHGYDLIAVTPNGSVVRHGGPGRYLKSAHDIADGFASWQRDVATRDQDPTEWERRIEERKRTYLAEWEFRREGAPSSAAEREQLKQEQARRSPAEWEQVRQERIRSNLAQWERHKQERARSSLED